MSQPAFSIITIARNDLRGLKRTVASVAAQSVQDVEHIVVDGASSDGTREWLSDRGSSRLRWTSEPDGGRYEAMNKGIERASGRLVMFVNSGDCLSEPATLSRVLEHFRQTGCTWTYGALRLTDEDGVPVGAYTFDPFRQDHFTMGLSWIPHASSCLTRDLVGELGGYRLDYGTMADQEFLLRATQKASPVALTWFVANYALGGVSQTTPPRERELAWHRMRRDNGLLWHGRLVDRSATELLALRKPARIFARRVAELGRETGR